MKNQKIQRVLLCCLLIILSASVSSETQQVCKVKLRNLINILEEYHYPKLTLDDEAVSGIKKYFLYNLDPSGLFFTGQDISTLLGGTLSADDLKNGEYTAFFNPVLECYQKRLAEAAKLVKNLLKNPPDYGLKETIILPSPDDPRYCEDINELQLKWMKLLKYEILLHFFYKNILDDSGGSARELFYRNEPNIRAFVEKQEVKRINNILSPRDGFQTFVFSVFLNSIAMSYDPHSMYFSYKNKTDFESSLATQAYSFGLYLVKNRREEIQIERMVPGGPAWKSAQLNKGDIISNIQISGREFRIDDLMALEQDEANRLINSAKTDRIILTVKKKNGLTKKVTLIKEKIEVEENSITGFMLEGSKKIGYLYLPAFYTDWDQTNNQGCANDLAREILKLKREHVEGIILDLRNNGGGSLAEAQSLAGIFIDEGPLLIQGGREGKPTVIKDANRGVIYEGPLVLMLNENSASASEFVASALRDYNRAVLVGRPTFGKASAQILLPVYKGTDFIHITTNLYYNLSGRTHQLSGLAPDIPLPGYLENAVYTEKSLPYAVKPETIKKKLTYQKQAALPIAWLAKRSAARLAHDTNFQEIRKIDNQLKKYFNPQVELPLCLEDFIREMRIRYDLLESLDKATTCVSPLFSVENTEYNREIIQMDPYRNERNKALKEQIQVDVYLGETYRIMEDLIKE